MYEQLNDIRSEEPAQKRRRVDIEPSQNGQSSDAAAASSASDVAKEDVLLEIKDISVSIPQRKKFDLCFTAGHLYARVPGTKAPAPGIIFPWKSIGMCAWELGSTSRVNFVRMALTLLFPLFRACFLPPSSRKGSGPT